MASRKPAKTLTTLESNQTVGIGGIGLVSLAIVSFGGIFIVIGYGWALFFSALIIILHWPEIREAIVARRLTRHLALPLVIVISIPVLTAMVANKDAILAWHPWRQDSAPASVVVRAVPPAQVTVEGPGATGSQSAGTINNFNAPTNQAIESPPSEKGSGSR